jgi:ribosomal protein S18 acetylase RimI-like enzyme
MSAVIEACRAADGIEWVARPEDLARSYAHLVNCDPFRDMLMVEVNGELISYNRGWWGRGENGAWVYELEGFLNPLWRGRGLGQAALNYMEARLREIAAGQPGDGPRFFAVWADDIETARAALLLGAGYQAERHSFHMVRPLSGPGAEPVAASRMPDGLEVRPVGSKQYRDVWEAAVEAFRDNFGYQPSGEADYQGWLDSPDFNADLWRVAFDHASGQVAGMVLNFVNERENAQRDRRRGYTEGISVRQPWRQRGLARALLTASLQMFASMGMSEAALGVDSENQTGAHRLYESVGFQVVKRATHYRKPL